MAKAVQNRIRPLLLSLAAVLFLALAVYAIRSFTHEPLPVRVTQVSHQDLFSRVSTNGKVEPVDGAEFQARAPGPNVVKKIFVSVNQHVEPGTLLIHLNDADARARRASAQAALAAARLGNRDVSVGGSNEELQRFRQDVAAAQVEQDRASSDLALKRTLQGKGAASLSEVQVAEQRLQNAETALSNAKSRLSGRFTTFDLGNQAARIADAQAAIAAAESTLSAIDIHSPISGTVYSIPVAEYDSVRDGDDLMDVADLNRMQIRAYFDEPEIGQLARGQAVSIVWDAKRDRTWHGHIERAPTTVIPYGTRSVGEALITVDDARGDLQPNSNVTVVVTTSEHRNVLGIPREALHTEDVSSYVFRIVAGKLVRTPVKVGMVNVTSAEIVGGLNDGDMVVLGPATPGQDLSDGLEVKRVK